MVVCSVLVLRAPIGFGDAAVFWSPAVFLERWCRIFVVTRWRWLSKRGTRIWSWCYIVCAVDSLFLSSLVQAIAYPVLHQFGALGTLFSLLCWSFSPRCHPYFHGSLSHYDCRPRSVLFLVAPLHGSFYPVLVVFGSVPAGDPSGGPLMSARRDSFARVGDVSLGGIG